MRELIAEVFLRHLGNPALDADADAVPLSLAEGEVMLTTDGFTVQPLEFPGRHDRLARRARNGERSRRCRRDTAST